MTVYVHNDAIPHIRRRVKEMDCFGFILDMIIGFLILLQEFIIIWEHASLFFTIRQHCCISVIRGMVPDVFHRLSFYKHTLGHRQTIRKFLCII